MSLYLWMVSLFFGEGIPKVKGPISGEKNLKFFYRRYVDDTFLIFKSPTQVKLFLDYLNCKHHNIKFTCDNEENSTLPFLDMNVKHVLNQISTSMFMPLSPPFSTRKFPLYFLELSRFARTILPLTKKSIL